MDAVGLKCGGDGWLGLGKMLFQEKGVMEERCEGSQVLHS